MENMKWKRGRETKLRRITTSLMSKSWQRSTNDFNVNTNTDSYKLFTFQFLCLKKNKRKIKKVRRLMRFALFFPYR